MLRVAAGASFVLVAATLAGFFGAGWWVFDLLANLRVQQALLLTLLAVVLLTVGPHWIAALAGMGVVLNLAVVAPALVGGGSTADPDAQSIDLTFLNVKIRAADPDELIPYLRQRDDDLVILAAGTRAWVDSLEAADLGLHVIEGPRRGSTSELIVLARDPRTKVLLQRSGEGSRSSLVEVIIDLEGQPLRVLGTHPVSPLTPARAARRDAHLAWIADWAGRTDDPVVVVGDLNTTPWSSAFRSLVTDGGLVDSLRGQGVQASWPAPLGPLGLPLDHVLHSRDLAVTDRTLGPSFGSDHRTVHATITRSANIT